MSIVERLDQFQRRHRRASFPLAVLYKYFDDGGGYLAALIAYYAFVSLFPLLLLLSTVLGLVLIGHPELQQRVLTSALSQFPVIGDQLGQPKQIGGGTVGLSVGVLGALYGGLGVGQALQNAMNTIWTVPRNSRPDPFRSRGRSLLLLVTAGLAVLATTVLSALGSSGSGTLGVAVKISLLLAAFVVNAVVFVFVFRVATGRPLTVREVAPGALAAAALWQLLQTFGVAYVGHVIKGASATNGVFALVLGLLAFLFITANAIVLCAEVNAVRTNKLYPRSLLTPFTDNVELTPGDRRSYRNQAQAQRSKGFERVEVSFHPPSDRDQESDEAEVTPSS
ncbi:MAG: YihY/virulence factor BrkB family protein [Marmoricola sp.]